MAADLNTLRQNTESGCVCLKISGDADSGNGGFSAGRKGLLERQGVGKFLASPNH
jgi:hypothetical protein